MTLTIIWIKKKETGKKEKSVTKEISFQDQKKLKSLKNKLSSVESSISKLEKEIAEIDHQLLMDYDATIAKPGFFDKYQKKKKTLEDQMKNWEEITLSLEEMAS